MTNAMIIMQEQIRLQEEGILKFTGRILKGVTPAGEEVEYPEIQPIHTYNGWKARGYQVKKGEKAIAKFPIWKYTKKKTKDMDEDEAQAKGFCFMKVSAWFTDEQVKLPGNDDKAGEIDKKTFPYLYDPEFDEEKYDMEQA